MSLKKIVYLYNLGAAISVKKAKRKEQKSLPRLRIITTICQWLLLLFLLDHLKRWSKPLCYKMSPVFSLYYISHSQRIFSQTNRRSVSDIKSYKGISYEINQWKISLFSKFNFLFQKFKLQSQVLFDKYSVWFGRPTPCWT